MKKLMEFAGAAFMLVFLLVGLCTPAFASTSGYHAATPQAVSYVAASAEGNTATKMILCDDNLSASSPGLSTTSAKDKFLVAARGHSVKHGSGLKPKGGKRPGRSS